MDENTSDANESVESSSDSTEASSAPAEHSAPESQAAPNTGSAPKEIPFHEHPRFQELVATKNQQMEQLRAYENRIRQFEAQLQNLSKPSQPPKVDELHQRLKGIDPEFGNRFEAVDKLRDEFQELRQWREAQEQQRVRDSAYAEVNRLHTQHELPDVLKPIYQAQLESLAAQNPNLKVNDIPRLYSEVHQNMVKILDSLRRSERESYVAEKKADAKAPANPGKGTPVAPSKGTEWSKNPEEARQQLISRVHKAMKAENDI